MRKNLIKILAILLCFTMMAVANVYAATTITTNQSGTDNGYYYSFWTDGLGPVTMTLGTGGNYSVNWSNCGNFICGKGWNPGSAGTIKYSGSFNSNNAALLAVYGCTTYPMAEYYVVESYGSWTPPGGTIAGNLISDGGIYYLYRIQKGGFIPEIRPYYQYWSVRTAKRTSGTVTMSNHFNAWANKGWNLGTLNYQLMATVGYQGSGSSNITVSEGPTPTQPMGPTASPTPTPTRSPNPYSLTYTIQSDWGNGASIKITIKNNTSTSVNGWTLAFTFPGAQTIYGLWSGTYTQSGATVSIKSSESNAYIPANGGSTILGFSLNYSGTNPKPTNFTLNGSACSVQ